MSANYSTNPEIGQAIPDFQTMGTSNQKFVLSEHQGSSIVLYFYPKDATPGCTTESLDFKKLHEAFAENKTLIFGISRDNLSSHEKFKSTHCFPFELLSDEDEKLCRLFNVIHPKNMYGKEVVGIERSTFLIDSQGILRKEWRKVKVENHAAKVLEAAQQLNQEIA